MAYTIDANVLIYASNADAPEHPRAQAIVRQMVSGPELSVALWPVLMAFRRIATHPRILPVPLTLDEAAVAVDQLIGAPAVRVVGDAPTYWAAFRSIRIGTPIRGNDVMDAGIVALMISNGVSTIYTRDRGFRRFDGIKVVDPFAAVE